MKTIFIFLNKLLDTLLFLTLAAMAVIVAANVFCRFILHFSLSWGDELAQILMVWLTFLGAAVGVREKSHYAFDYLVHNLPNKVKTLFTVLSELIAITAISGLLWWSTEVTIGIRNWIMPATEINRAFVYGACPVGCFFMLVYALRNLVTEIHGRGLKHGESGRENIAE